MADTDARLTCTECTVEKDRYADFSPRWSTCAAHARHDSTCAECRRRKRGYTRQPRCKECDRARGRRRSCLNSLKRIANEAGLPPNAIEAVNAATQVVRVRHLPAADSPQEVLCRLRERSSGVIELDTSEAFLGAAEQLPLDFPLPVSSEPPAGSRSHAPLLDLCASAGSFGEFGLPERQGFVDTGRLVRAGQFVVRLNGRSMEPTLRHGSFSLFEPAAAGSHLQQQIVLAQARVEFDPEGGGRFTVKRYVQRGKSRRRVRLEPINPEFDPIDVGPQDEVRILARHRFVLESA